MKKILGVFMVLGLMFSFAVNIRAMGLSDKGDEITPVSITRTLLDGQKGDDIKYLQQILIQKGFLAGSIADGNFDTKTKVAVMAFQKANNLVADGKFGAKSRAIIVPTSSENCGFDGKQCAQMPTPTPAKDFPVRTSESSIHVFYVADGLMLPSTTFAFLSGSGLSINPILNYVLGLSIGQHGTTSSQQGEVSSIKFKLLSSLVPLSPTINYYLINSTGGQIGQPQTLNSNNELIFNNVGDTHSGTYDRRLFLTADQSLIGKKARFIVTDLDANTYSGTQNNMIYTPVSCSKIILPEGNTSC